MRMKIEKKNNNNNKKLKMLYEKQEKKIPVIHANINCCSVGDVEFC